MLFDTPVYYLRAVVEGDSLFAGTSPAWRIETGQEAVLPPDLNRGSGAVEEKNRKNIQFWYNRCRKIKRRWFRHDEHWILIIVCVARL